MKNNLTKMIFALLFGVFFLTNANAAVNVKTEEIPTDEWGNVLLSSYENYPDDAKVIFLFERNGMGVGWGFGNIRPINSWDAVPPVPVSYELVDPSSSATEEISIQLTIADLKEFAKVDGEYYVDQYTQKGLSIALWNGPTLTSITVEVVLPEIFTLEIPIIDGVHVLLSNYENFSDNTIVIFEFTGNMQGAGWGFGEILPIDYWDPPTENKIPLKVPDGAPEEFSIQYTVAQLKDFAKVDGVYHEGNDGRKGISLNLWGGQTLASVFVELHKALPEIPVRDGVHILLQDYENYPNDTEVTFEFTENTFAVNWGFGEILPIDYWNGSPVKHTLSVPVGATSGGTTNDNFSLQFTVAQLKDFAKIYGVYHEGDGGRKGITLNLWAAKLSRVILENGETLWTGAANDQWTDAGNWNSAVIPLGANNVIIPANVPNYPILSDNVLVKNLIISEGAAIDLNGKTLKVTDKIKVKSNVVAEKWLAVGFPFSINSLFSEWFDEEGWDANLYPYSETPYEPGFHGDFWMKHHTGSESPFDFIQEWTAGKGHIIHFPDWFDETDGHNRIIYISADNQTITDSEITVTEEYKLVANTKLKTQNLIQGADNKYYYKLNNEGTTFVKPVANAPVAIAPFEAVLAILVSDPSMLRSSLGIDETTAIINTKIQDNDPVVSEHYYTLQGILVEKPAAAGVYIVRQTLQSGQERSIKIIHNSK
ncbi:MAG: hypothetical protein LBI82_02145 [Dysgonamonadaceae bacterium]|jgi:uncharacterized lipoprotein YehR (DUF1307 family)|nr:hypothetical protein [Dysgonamonadaceae bacterium]